MFRKIEIDLEDMECEGLEGILIDWQGGFIGQDHLVLVTSCWWAGFKTFQFRISIQRLDVVDSPVYRSKLWQFRWRVKFNVFFTLWMNFYHFKFWIDLKFCMKIFPVWQYLPSKYESLQTNTVGIFNQCLAFSKNHWITLHASVQLTYSDNVKVLGVLGIATCS